MTTLFNFILARYLKNPRNHVLMYVSSCPTALHWRNYYHTLICSLGLISKWTYFKITPKNTWFLAQTINHNGYRRSYRYHSRYYFLKRSIYPLLSIYSPDLFIMGYFFKKPSEIYSFQQTNCPSLQTRGNIDKEVSTSCTRLHLGFVFVNFMSLNLHLGSKIKKKLGAGKNQKMVWSRQR